MVVSNHYFFTRLTNLPDSHGYHHTLQDKQFDITQSETQEEQLKQPYKYKSLRDDPLSKLNDDDNEIIVQPDENEIRLVILWNHIFRDSIHRNRYMKTSVSSRLYTMVTLPEF